MFIPNLLDTGQQQSQSVMYMLRGRKKKKGSNGSCQSLYSKIWPILSNIVAHLKGSGKEIEVKLTKGSVKEVQKKMQQTKSNC